MDFSDQQRQFLATICHYFHENGEWPTYDYLDRTLANEPEDIDVVEVGRKLDSFMFEGASFYQPMMGWDPDRHASLTVSALHTCLIEGVCPELAEDFDAFLQVVQLAVERYRARSTNNPELTAAEVRELLGISDPLLRKVFELISHVGFTNGSTSPYIDADRRMQWRFNISRSVRSYYGATTMTAFLSERQRIRDEQRVMYQSPPSPPSVPSMFRRSTPITQDRFLASGAIADDAREATDAVLESDLVAGTRGYIEKVVRQINTTYDADCFDACAVMVRRLVETLIIEAFEANGIADHIKKPTGEFMQLRELVEKALAETSWNIGRNSRTALPRLKDIGDKSAHDRRINAMRRDIDRIKDYLRTVTQELLSLAKLK